MSSILVQVIVGGLLLGAVYALFSSGLTLIWGMMNIVNFAHGDFVMLGMYVAFVVWTVLGVGPFVGAPVAALVLATLGIIVYFGLIRSVMKGPMLAQILGTFGLALLLRYSVFWGFGANFLTLPADLVGGTYDVLGIKLQASRLLAGVVALAGDAGAAPVADAHVAGLEDARGRRGCHRGAIDGHPPRQHAGDRLGDRGWRHGTGRRADRDLLLHRADGRRDARHRRLRHGVARRFRQRAGRAGRGASDRRHRVRCRPTGSARSTRTSWCIRCSCVSSGSGRKA